MAFRSPGTDNATLREILGELQAQRAGGRHPFEDLFLETDQERVLATMDEAERRVPRERSHPFILVGAGDGYSLVPTMVSPTTSRSLRETFARSPKPGCCDPASVPRDQRTTRSPTRAAPTTRG